MKPLRGFLSGISTPMWGTFSALWERVCKGPQVLRTHGYPKVAHLRRPLHSLCPLRCRHNMIYFTNLVSAPTDTTIQIFFIFVGDYRKKPNSERSKAAKSP